MPYDRSEKEFRDFRITYGILERTVLVEARSSLEAGLNFQQCFPFEEPHSIEDLKVCLKITKFRRAA